LNKTFIFIALLAFHGAIMASDIIFTSKDGQVLTTQDLEDLDATVNWQIKSDKPIPAAAKVLHQQGRQYGQTGQNDKAVAAFKAAIKIAPQWSYPYYDLAYTYMLSGDLQQAYQYYEKVNQLSPNGFFTAITAAHYLQLELKGKYPQGLYLYYLSHEWDKTPAQQLALFANIVKKFPNYAPAWQKLADLYQDNAAKQDAIERGLSSEPDKETEGFLLINKSIMLYNSGDKKQALALLGELVLDPQSLTNINLIAKKTIAMLVNSK